MTPGAIPLSSISLWHTRYGDLCKFPGYQILDLGRDLAFKVDILRHTRRLYQLLAGEVEYQFPLIFVPTDVDETGCSDRVDYVVGCTVPVDVLFVFNCPDQVVDLIEADPELLDDNSEQLSW